MGRVLARRRRRAAGGGGAQVERPAPSATALPEGESSDSPPRQRLRAACRLSTLVLCLLALGCSGAQLALGAEAPPSGPCVTKQGPVGDPFVDCSEGKAFNLVPPGQTGTYSAADLAAAELGQGFPAHTRDQEPLYATCSISLRTSPKRTSAGSTRTRASWPTSLRRKGSRPSPPPRRTVIVRDKQFGVPHIFGRTRADPSSAPATPRPRIASSRWTSCGTWGGRS